MLESSSYSNKYVFAINYFYGTIYLVTGIKGQFILNSA